VWRSGQMFQELFEPLPQFSDEIFCSSGSFYPPQPPQFITSFAQDKYERQDVLQTAFHREDFVAGEARALMHNSNHGLNSAYINQPYLQCSSTAISHPSHHFQHNAAFAQREFQPPSIENSPSFDFSAHPMYHQNTFATFRATTPPAHAISQHYHEHQRFEGNDYTRSYTTAQFDRYSLIASSQAIVPPTPLGTVASPSSSSHAFTHATTTIQCSPIKQLQLDPPAIKNTKIRSNKSLAKPKSLTKSKPKSKPKHKSITNSIAPVKVIRKAGGHVVPVVQCNAINAKTGRRCKNTALMEYEGPQPLHCAEHIHMDTSARYHKCAFSINGKRQVRMV
jgi:hypothetical protein